MEAAAAWCRRPLLGKAFPVAANPLSLALSRGVSVLAYGGFTGGGSRWLDCSCIVRRVEPKDCLRLVDDRSCGLGVVDDNM